MSSDDSDDDYVPGKPEQLSEEESAGDETEQQYNNEAEETKKRKLNKQQRNGNTKKNKRRSKTPEKSDEEIPVCPEEEKKREDDLWASFLGESSSKPKEETPKPSAKKLETTEIKNKSTVKVKKDDGDLQNRESRIFEFAGEKVVVENNVIVDVVKADSSTKSPAVTTKPAQRGGGISNILGQLSKKNKLSTLEKSKLDWDTYKKNEGIEEEIQTFNRGKNGYLEKKDFLERADYRQYEMERDIRANKRSNR